MFLVDWVARHIAHGSWRRAFALLALALLAACRPDPECLVVGDRSVTVNVPRGFCVPDLALVDRMRDIGLLDDAGRAQVLFAHCDDIAGLTRDPRGPEARLVTVVAAPELVDRGGRALTGPQMGMVFRRVITMMSSQLSMPFGNTLRLFENGIRVQSLRAIGGITRGRDDEAMGQFRMEATVDGQPAPSEMALAATALNDVPVLIVWSWPNTGREATGRAHEAMFNHLDALKSTNARGRACTRA